YVLPPHIAQLRSVYPQLNVSLHQGAPDQVAQMVINETAAIGIAPESLANYPELVTLPCYEWQHVLVLPQNHRLAKVETITLEELAQESIITYHPSFTGRTRIDKAFANQRLSPRIALKAIDSDVIKTYVQLGMGVGIVAEMAAQNDNQDELIIKPAGYLFGKNLARIAFKRGSYLRNFVYEFARLLNPELSRQDIMNAINNFSNPSTE
ncbi:MAG: transcriptional regulator, partial [Limnohabitans sp.]|nr:transcriptional regulator [Limnohabitans sp.]